LIEKYNSFVDMRIIINGTDKAVEIADLAEKYLSLLNEYYINL
jgi:hypothetical protein